jgi:hypothetical protein
MPQATLKVQLDDKVVGSIKLSLLFAILKVTS